MKNVNLWLRIGCLLLMAVPAFAQSASKKMKAEVPFDFMVANQTLPAGEYLVTAPQDSVVLIRSVDDQHKATQIVHSRQQLNPSDTSKLVFNKYGDRYFLAQVWAEGNDIGRELPESKLERDIQRNNGAERIALNLKMIRTGE